MDGQHIMNRRTFISGSIAAATATAGLVISNVVQAQAQEALITEVLPLQQPLPLYERHTYYKISDTFSLNDIDAIVVSKRVNCLFMSPSHYSRLFSLVSAQERFVYQGVHPTEGKYFLLYNSPYDSFWGQVPVFKSDFTGLDIMLDRGYVGKGTITLY